MTRFYTIRLWTAPAAHLWRQQVPSTGTVGSTPQRHLDGAWQVQTPVLMLRIQSPGVERVGPAVAGLAAAGLLAAGSPLAVVEPVAGQRVQTVQGAEPASIHRR